jgi:ribose transport system ATP-binding protein
MRDGKVVAGKSAGAFTRATLVAAMGSVAEANRQLGGRTASQRRTGAARVAARPPRQTDGRTLVAHRGEIVGLAGLDGHGQKAMLLSIFARRARRGEASVDGPVALVAGDRQTEGIFPLWSIARNVGIRSLKGLRRGPFIDASREDALAEHWRKKISIRTPDIHDNILSLSGGNQQKTLFARALASDAEIILMDDPMRGVDVGTKQEVYAMIRAEAAAGRTFIWYTTEIDELDHCDHIYVFRNGRISDDLTRSELTEEKVLHASFEDRP